MKSTEALWDHLKKSVIDFLPDLISALIIAGAGILIAFIIVRVIRKACKRRKADPSLTGFICKAARILIYVFTLMAAMSALKISTAGLIAFFSTATAAIAIALKDRLNDIASGIVILFSKPFVTGDFIEFGDYRGFVQKVDIMHTNILTYEGTNVIIPNSVISNSEVNNHTTQPVVRVQVDIPIPYESDIGKVKEVLYDVLKNTEHLVHDEKHHDSVQLQKYGDSALEFNIRCYCDFKDYWTVYYDLTESVKNALDENRITIPFNQLDVHLVP